MATENNKEQADLKEWWISISSNVSWTAVDYHKVTLLTEFIEHQLDDYIKVIEYSAYAELQRQLDDMEQAIIKALYLYNDFHSVDDEKVIDILRKAIGLET